MKQPLKFDQIPNKKQARNALFNGSQPDIMARRAFLEFVNNNEFKNDKNKDNLLLSAQTPEKSVSNPAKKDRSISDSPIKGNLKKKDSSLRRTSLKEKNIFFGIKSFIKKINFEDFTSYNENDNLSTSRSSK